MVADNLHALLIQPTTIVSHGWAHQQRVKPVGRVVLGLSSQRVLCLSWVFELGLEVVIRICLIAF